MVYWGTILFNTNINLAIILKFLNGTQTGQI